MSLKWQRSKQWDEENIPRALWPVQAVLRALSSIPLAVITLVLVLIYAVTASVPIGLLALIPTYAIYAATLIGAILILGGVPATLFSRILKHTGAGKGVCFATFTLSLVGLGVGAAWLWWMFAWPRLSYDAGTGEGFRLFAEFVAAYDATTVRRLPAFEMTELEYYSWWPFRLLLILFVVNMVVATVRRIEFSFPNLGVLTVHTGIVVMALGCLYYKRLKQEGDMILLAGQVDQTGTPTPGPLEDVFYDNTELSLWVNDGTRWDQRQLKDIPRYNDYNLTAGLDGETPGSGEPGHGHDSLPPLDLRVPTSTLPGLAGLSMRVVGYASYAEPVFEWVRMPEPAPGQTATPIRVVSIQGIAPDDPEASARASLWLVPGVPARRVSENELFSVEYLRNVSEERWRDITEPGTRRPDALTVELPGPAPVRETFPIEQGTTRVIGAFEVEVLGILDQPPFPIITPGFEGATSSLAQVKISMPLGETRTRWVYHRYPEISQDFLDQVTPSGMPAREAADDRIKLVYHDDSRIFQVFIDERDDGTIRAAVRRRDGTVAIHEDLGIGDTIPDLVPGAVSLSLDQAWQNARQVEHPHAVHEEERDPQFIGTHANAMLGVEVSDESGWSQTVWLPFSQYMGIGMGAERQVTLPSGRRITLAFGRRAHRLADFGLQLLDFEMIAYDHRGSPRDFQSRVRVVPTGTRDFEQYVHITKLNAPLQAPFMAREELGWWENAIGTVASRLNPRQFKFSQSGWDQQGWQASQTRVDAGEFERPHARWTILGVGNNPGIHIVALGSMLVVVGIPWAFYIKPLIVKRRSNAIRKRIQQEREAEQSVPESADELVESGVA